jgi:hypothetical protein
MTASAFDLLRDTLDRRFDDGSRRAVLILGAGLHHHLRAHDTDPNEPAWAPFCDWNGLLVSVAKDLGVPVLRHQDPTATWEELVARTPPGNSRIEKQSSRNARAQTANSAEERALHHLSERLKTLPSSTPRVTDLGKALHDANYRDLITLNFDLALHEAFASVEGTTASPQHESGVLSLHTDFRRADRFARLWYAHGVASRPDSIQLGMRSYGRTAFTIVDAWNAFKQRERHWRDLRAVSEWQPDDHAAWEGARRSNVPWQVESANEALQWVELFFLSDLVFLGCSLDRAEFDLWWTLNQRRRNVYSIQAADKPRTFILTTRKQLGALPHLSTSPAGVLPVIFEDWDDAWEAALGRWW